MQPFQLIFIASVLSGITAQDLFVQSDAMDSDMPQCINDCLEDVKIAQGCKDLQDTTCFCGKDAIATSLVCFQEQCPEGTADTARVGLKFACLAVDALEVVEKNTTMSGSVEGRVNGTMSSNTSHNTSSNTSHNMTVSSRPFTHPNVSVAVNGTTVNAATPIPQIESNGASSISVISSMALLTLTTVSSFLT